MGATTSSRRSCACSDVPHPMIHMAMKRTARELMRRKATGAHELAVLIAMAECWICLRPFDSEAKRLQLPCGHRFHEACLLEVQEVSSGCPACSDQGRWSAEGLCRAAAVEYLRAVRSTAAETPARHVVMQRCWSYLQDALAENHVKSMVLAGILHQAGLGTERSDAKAFEFFSRAQAAGDPRGGLHLARCYKKGTGCGQDTYRARALFSEASRAGNTMATLELALMCRSGLGGEKDLAMAMELFEKADAEGDALGAFELGKAYLNGNGKAKDAEAARRHMESAHARGYTLASVELGQMYLSGIGGPQDVQRGQELLMQVDFPTPKPLLDERCLRMGWVSHTAMELYESDIARLNEDGLVAAARARRGGRRGSRRYAEGLRALHREGQGGDHGAFGTGRPTTRLCRGRSLACNFMLRQCLGPDFGAIRFRRADWGSGRHICRTSWSSKRQPVGLGFDEFLAGRRVAVEIQEPSAFVRLRLRRMACPSSRSMSWRRTMTHLCVA